MNIPQGTLKWGLWERDTQGDTQEQLISARMFSSLQGEYGICGSPLGGVIHLLLEWIV